MNYTKALPCIICGRELYNSMPGVQNQPSGGVYATTTGNYGSTVFDAFHGEFLEVNFCDPCLVEAGERGRVLTGNRRSSIAAEPLTPWKSTDEL